MLNPSLDFPTYWRRFVECGRVQMRQVLLPELAEQLHDHLNGKVCWQLAVRDEDGVSRARDVGSLDDVDEPGYQREMHAAAIRARQRYGFVYETHMMVRAYRERRDPDSILHRVLEYMNAAPYLEFCRTVAAEQAIRRVSAQATRFRPGMFLKAHNDFDAAEGRVVAYVLNLSRDWQPDWGGLLQFLDDDGGIAETFVPHFNSLSLFRVPAQHCVSLVAPWALRPRLAITGWWETLAATPRPG